MTNNNYDSYKAGTGLTDDQICFILHEDAVVPNWDKERQNYYWWAIGLFARSIFMGPKKSCEKHLKDFPNHKIVEPQFHR